MYATAGIGALGLGLLLRRGDKEDTDVKDMEALSKVPLRRLVSGWISFAFCASPTWVEASETMYNIVSRVPIISSIANSFIIHTFFSQFLGGQTTQECIPKVRQLRDAQLGTLLGYNIEATLDGSSKDPNLILKQTQSVLESIDVQAKLAKEFTGDAASDPEVDNKCWVRLKITGLLNDPSALEAGSRAILKARAAQGLDKDVPLPGLPHDGDWEAALDGDGVTPYHRDQLVRLRATMEGIISKARDNNIRVVIDAEQSWYQPVLDALTDEFMQKYNKLGGPATCIASFQAYLRRHPQLLEQQIKRAEEKGYKLLYKQVRGAYIVSEAAWWKQKSGEEGSVVWPTKEDTDASYNSTMERAISLITDQVRSNGSARFGAVFATHNAHSIDKGIQLLDKTGFLSPDPKSRLLLLDKNVANSVTFAQLFGMKDDLTNRITGTVAASNGLPLVVKSMSYGELSECIPFLSRRANENKAILSGRGGALSERKRLGREIQRRLSPFGARVQKS
ncbi:unnamed protein product [Clonostachys byssicola]|uniref:Proline dehydrogenase n=1 Tax=Clonostachys byssicola TaxID=160290 RepID=A0A9N9UEC5_9HYPO|nr:unnamed protein product [Clonostachys byssicola]